MHTIHKDTINLLMSICYTRAVQAGWHNDPCTMCNGIKLPEGVCGMCLGTGSVRVERNIGELFAHVHAELGEAWEGFRKRCQDDHLPHRKMVEVELADVIIRIGNLVGELVYQGYLANIDIGGAIGEKLDYNLYRLDHKWQERMKAGGKKL